MEKLVLTIIFILPLVSSTKLFIGDCSYGFCEQICKTIGEDVLSCECEAGYKLMKDGRRCSKLSSRLIQAGPVASGDDQNEGSGETNEVTIINCDNEDGNCDVANEKELESSGDGGSLVTVKTTQESKTVNETISENIPDSTSTPTTTSGNVTSFVNLVHTTQTATTETEETPLKTTPALTKETDNSEIHLIVNATTVSTEKSPSSQPTLIGISNTNLTTHSSTLTTTTESTTIESKNIIAVNETSRTTISPITSSTSTLPPWSTEEPSITSEESDISVIVNSTVVPLLETSTTLITENVSSTSTPQSTTETTPTTTEDTVVTKDTSSEIFIVSNNTSTSTTDYSSTILTTTDDTNTGTKTVYDTTSVPSDTPTTSEVPSTAENILTMEYDITTTDDGFIKSVNDITSSPTTAIKIEPSLSEESISSSIQLDTTHRPTKSMSIFINELKTSSALEKLTATPAIELPKEVSGTQTHKVIVNRETIQMNPSSSIIQLSTVVKKKPADNIKTTQRTLIKTPHIEDNEDNEIDAIVPTMDLEENGTNAQEKGSAASKHYMSTIMYFINTVVLFFIIL